MVVRRRPLESDPIDEAIGHWTAAGWGDVAEGMALVTSVMRVQQLLVARVDAALRTHRLSFARFEVLMLLLFSSRGSLPIGKIGERLQVHPASVTNAVQRLAEAGMVERWTNPDDGRSTLVAPTDAGRAVALEAAATLNAEVFADVGLGPDDRPRGARHARPVAPRIRRLRVSRRRGLLVVPLVATAIASAVVGCGSDGPDVASPTSSAVPASAVPASAVPASHGSTSDGRPAASDDTATTADTSVSGPGIDGVTGALVLTRQRDLIDRGLINVMIDNRSGRDLMVADRALVADHFEIPPAPPRTVKITDGRQVAVQVPYGEALDCTDAAPVTAHLAFTDAGVSRRLELAGTDILDGIRAEQCIGRALHDAVDVDLRDATVVDGTVEATLHLELADADAVFEIGRVGGTILIAARRSNDQPVVLDGEHRVADVPVTFTVNRCDPHGLAEVTRPYGLDVEVGQGGSERADVAIDVGDLHDDFAAIVEQCRAASGG